MPGAALIPIDPPKVEFLLHFVAHFEAPKSEVDRNRACDTPVAEQQIEAKVLVAQFKGLGDRSKPGG